MKRRIFLFSMPILLLACFFVLAALLYPVFPAKAAVGNFILSGGAKSADNFCVDDDIYVYLDGNLIYADIDLRKASCNNRPIYFQADAGAVLRIVAIDSAGICRSIGPLWLHYWGQSVELDSGKYDGCQGWPAGMTFYDRTFIIPQSAEPEPVPWILKTSMPTARSGPASSVIGGKIYVAGGGDAAGAALNNLEAYDPAADSWEIKPPMPSGRWGLTSGIIDGKYYVVAGGSPTPNGTVKTEEFDPATSQWLAKRDMPNPGWGVASGVINNKFYVVGGYNWPNSGMNFNREYDPATNQWTLKAPMPTKRSWLGAEVIDNKLYAVGGWNFNDTVDLPTLEVYDPASDNWAAKANLPAGLRSVATAVLDGKLYVFGGVAGAGASAKWYASVYVYDPAADAWTRLADLPQAVAGAAAETVDGSIYLFGGSTKIAKAINTTYVWPSELTGPVEEPDPVILVPGIMGSWNVNGEWELDPILHTYDNLWQALKNAGYVEGETLFAFPYEWRQDNTLTAYQLKQRIDEVKNICDCDKVDVVAHSMGGLVARVYAESDYYGGDIDQLVFLGTPHQGSPESYLRWEGAGGFEDLRARIVKLYFALEAHNRGYNSLFDYIQNYVKSVEQLLPDYAYLQNLGETGLRIYDKINYPNNYPYNTFLENINLVDKINQLAGSGIRIMNFIGDTGNNTINAIKVSPGEPYWPMWKNGYAEESIRLTGDGTVPEVSSSLFIPTKINGAEHLALPTKAQSQVIEYLAGNLPTVEITDTKEPEKLLVVRIFSPADFMIIAPNGERLGKDFTSDQAVNEIPGAFYSGFNSDAEFAVIPDPIDGEYRVEMQGTGQGEYKLSASLIDDSQETDKEFSGSIETGQERNFTIDYTAQAGGLISELEPEDTVPPVITINTPQPNQQFLHNQDLAIDYSATDDFSGLATTTITIGGQTVATATIDLFDYSLGQYNLVITAIDKTGNQAQAQVSFEIITNIDSTIADMGEISSRGWIDDKIYHRLIENLFELKGKDGANEINNFLNLMIRSLDKAKKQNQLNQLGYDIIINDINYLRENL